MALKGVLSAFKHKSRKDALASSGHDAADGVPDISEPVDKYGLKFLNESQFETVREKGQDRFSLDIVAVHGLNGDAYKTWTHKNGKLWLRDFLPQQYPGARIFSFGYSSEVAFTMSKGKLPGFSRSLLEGLMANRRTAEELSRPIIFICHSMGGIVVKNALIIALIDSGDYGQLRQSVKGICFFATPHRGSSASGFGQVVANIANVCLTGTSRLTGKMRMDLIQSLETNSGELKTISTNFRNQTSDIKIVSFIEQKLTPPLSSLVVDEHSGVMDVAGETVVPMDGCDHSGVCRFASPKSGLYSIVSRHLDKLATAGGDVSELTEEEKNCLKSLSFPEASSRYFTVSDALRSTCSWLFELPAYCNWTSQDVENDSKNIIWIRGRPGSGKSTLMKCAYRRMTEESKDNASTLQQHVVTAVFFFHARGIDLERTRLGMIRSLLHQLLHQIPSARRAFLPHYRKKRDTQQPGWTWHLEELQEHLRSLVSQAVSRSTAITFFIDAVDECRGEDIRSVIAWAEDITSVAGTSLKICLSSRYYPNITIKRCEEIHVEKYNGTDISTFVHNKMKGFDREDLPGLVIEKASGVFLWVVLVVDRLLTALDDGETESMIYQQLDAIPPDLTALYSQTIGAIPPEDKPASARIMTWVLFGGRPLTPRELRYALAFYDNAFASQAECKKSPGFIKSDGNCEKLLRKWSRGLIEITNPAASGAEPTVQFIHESVREFMLQEDRLTSIDASLCGPGKAIGIGNLRLHRACLNYVKITELHDQYQSEENASLKYDHNAAVEQLRVLSRDYPFLEYAVTWIFRHAAAAEKEDVQMLDLTEFFPFPLTRHGLSRVWMWYLHLIRQTTWEPPLLSGTTMLHIAGLFGLPRYAATLIAQGVDVNSRDSSGHSALHSAASTGHDTVIDTLVKGGVDIEARNARGHTALHQATARNGEKAVRALLRHGCDIMAQNNNGHTALHYAGAEGRGEIAEILLSQGADIAAVNSMGETPLHQAAARGHETAVEILLRHGADPNLKANNGETALHQGAAAGHRAVVKALIDHGADINAESSRGETALQEAKIGGHTDVIQLLMGAGAGNANSTAQGKTDADVALYQTVIASNKPAIDSLVKDDPPTYTSLIKGVPAIHQAASEGNAAGVMVLIRHGADYEEKTSDGLTALHYAAAWGKREAVEMLIRHSADIKAKDRRGYTVLQYALANGHEEVAKLLIRYGAHLE